MPVVIILLDPICQILPKISQICQNYCYMCKIDIFDLQQTKLYYKTPKLGLDLFKWVKIALSYEKIQFFGFFGLWISRFWSHFGILHPFYYPNILQRPILTHKTNSNPVLTLGGVQKNFTPNFLRFFGGCPK